MAMYGDGSRRVLEAMPCAQKAGMLSFRPAEAAELFHVEDQGILAEILI